MNQDPNKQKRNYNRRTFFGIKPEGVQRKCIVCGKEFVSYANTHIHPHHRQSQVDTAIRQSGVAAVLLELRFALDL